MKLIRILPFLFLITISITATADVRLPKLISNGMVLQRDTKLTIWGWASKGEKVAVLFNGKTYKTVALADGSWKVILPPVKAGGPYVMSIKGNNAIEISNIMIGDVWLCSGQSNMVLNMERVKEKYPDEIANANYPMIRNFFIPTYSDVTKTYKDLPGGKWVVTTPETVLEFSAVAYFFAKDISTKLNVPVGIINASVGGTPTEAWISEEGMKKFPELSELIKKNKDSIYIKNLISSNPPANTNSSTGDEGLNGQVKWYDIEFTGTDWHDFWLPGYWADQGVKNLNGVLWFKKEINLPESMAGKTAKLFMGRIVDADQTYVNGVLVGNITYQYPPRRYSIPAGLLKSGKNTIVVRLINNSGKGGFVPDKPYFLQVENEKIDLRGQWKYKIGQVFAKNEGPNPVTFSAQNSPTGLYNTMIAPIIPYAIKGINWYQGEANTSKPDKYSDILSALIADWRIQWNLGNIPFSIVQLANFMEVQYSPVESQWATLRNEQRKTLAVPNTALVVAIDAGEWNDIHPLNKKDIGKRLALAARHLAYGDNKVVYSGPLYQSKEIQGDKMILSFSNIGGGLVAKDGEKLNYFEIAGADHKYVWANAKIEGDKIVVSSDKITSPVKVRYAWADNPERANLYNKEGLPASPFETEN